MAGRLRLSAAPPLRWLIGQYARPYAVGLSALVGVTLAANLVTVLQPAILAAMLANLAGSAGAAVPDGASALDLNHLGTRVSQRIGEIVGADVDVLLVFGALFALAAILVAALNFLAESTAAWLRARIAQRLQSQLLTHLLSLDMAFFSRQKSGELLSRLTTDTNATAQAIGPLVRSVLHNVVQIAVYAAYLFSTSAWLSVGAAGLLVTQFGLTQVLRRPIARLVRGEHDRSADFLTAVQEAVTGIRVTKSFGAEAHELTKLMASTEALAGSVWRKGRLEKLEAPVRSVFDALAVLGVLFIAIAQMRGGTLTLEGLLLFTYVARLLITPINQIATSALWMASTNAASSRIRDLLAVRPRVVDGPTVMRTFDHALTLESVTFAHDDRPAIDGISLEIRKGEFVALVGASGAGKSTLADLVLRLYDPQQGVVRIDGVDLRELRQREYRQLFGVVSQETLLFHDSVRSNIRFGRADVSDADIEQAARVAYAHDFISRLPRGYDTVVGDRGVRLSGGERQRVAIARALVHRPQILILDEATSALDSESERLVQAAINRVVRDTTALVIAHRLSTVTHADRIVVLNAGRIEAIGRHDELLDTSETYRRFSQQQFLTAVPTA